MKPAPTKNDRFNNDANIDRLNAIIRNSFCNDTMGFTERKEEIIKAGKRMSFNVEKEYGYCNRHNTFHYRHSYCRQCDDEQLRKYRKEEYK